MIVHLTSEVAPFYKRGGLGDVVGALPKYLVERQANAVISFFYEGRMKKEYLELKKSFKIQIQGVQYEFIYYHQQIEGVDFYFLNMSDDFLFSDMESGEGDLLQEDGEKPYRNNSSYIIYLYFAKAALQLIDNLSLFPEYIICHDWHVCGCFVFPTMIERLKEKSPCTTILLIHNYEHQGEILPDGVHLLEDEVLSELNMVFDQYGSVTFLSLGLKKADYVATVSSTYAQELLNHKAPHTGLKFLDSIKKKKIYDLPNGIDAALWSPDISPYITHRYNKETAAKMKRIARQEMEEMLQLPASAGPMILMMARLTEQKGIDLLLNLWASENEAMDNIRRLLDRGITLVLCGRPSGGITGNIHKRLLRAQTLYPNQFRYLPGYNEQLAHQLLAAADAILCPSLYEPCGLVQIYAMSFGTIPIVRPVGGLRDTVTCYNENLPCSTGFYIEEFSFGSLLHSMEQVVDIYNSEKEVWYQLVQRCMEQDFSWDHIKNNYFRLFDTISQEIAYNYK